MAAKSDPAEIGDVEPLADSTARQKIRSSTHFLSRNEFCESKFIKFKEDTNEIRLLRVCYCYCRTDMFSVNLDRLVFGKKH